MQKPPDHRPNVFTQNVIFNRAQMIIIIAAGAFVLLMTIISGAFSNFYVRNVDTTSHSTIAILIFFEFFILGCAGLALVTQRVFGPLLRVHRDIKQRLNGENPPLIVLRKRDYLTDFVADYNQSVEKK